MPDVGRDLAQKREPVVAEDDVCPGEARPDPPHQTTVPGCREGCGGGAQAREVDRGTLGCADGGMSADRRHQRRIVAPGGRQLDRIRLADLDLVRARGRSPSRGRHFGRAGKRFDDSRGEPRGRSPGLLQIDEDGVKPLQQQR
jgi:hypothetical protein